MKPNKQIFLGVSKRISDICRPLGYVDHPAYDTGWDAGNQFYQCTLIQKNLAPYIDQLEISFAPKDRTFYFSVTRSNNTFGIKDIDDIPTEASDWTDLWLYSPHHQYQLYSGSAWRFFSRKTGHGLAKRDMADTDFCVDKIVKSFERHAPYLFDALEGRYQGGLVNVQHYDIAPPEHP